MRTATLAAVVLLFGASTLTVFGQADITVEELKDHVGYLASDELEGRKPGTPGGDAAAQYIRSQIAQRGITLLGDEGYQYFDIVTSVAPTVECRLVVPRSAPELGVHFMPLSFSGEIDAGGHITFAGYGLDFEGDSVSWDSYGDLDVHGRWVLLLRGAPGDDPEFDAHTSLRSKALKAQDRGAVGVLFASGPQFDPDDVLPEMTYQQQEGSLAIPVMYVKREIADAALSSAGQKLADLETLIRETGAPASMEIPIDAEGGVRLDRHVVRAKNVIALLPGSDESLREEFVVIGAHYDHLGMGGPGTGSRVPDTTAVHNGADDNASGTAAIVEIFERLAAMDPKPKRSIIFAAFTAEEMGLLGSKEFVNNPPVDLSRIQMMVNLDMVGRMDASTKSFSVGGVGTAEGLEARVKEQTEAHGFKAALSTEGYGPSDHASFYTRDIPVLFFFTGVHDDYHTPADVTEKINFDGEKGLADCVTDIVVEIANDANRLAFVEAGPKQPQATGRRFKVTLGIMPDVTGGDGDGLRVDAVMDGRPAKMSGMLKGDVIVSIEGKSVTGIYDYMSRLSELKTGQRISVEVLRGDERKVLIVQL